MIKVDSSSKKTIGFASRINPFVDRKAWSGTCYKIREAIEEAGYKVIWIRVRPNKLLSFITKAILKLLGQVKYWEMSKYYGLLCANSVCIDEIAQCDYVFFPGRAQMIDYLKRRIKKRCSPFIYYTDATFKLMDGYYWHGIPKWICNQANYLEKTANDCCSLILKSSEWAINSAIYDYGCPEEKTGVLEFGANIDEKDIVVNKPYSNGTLRVLFSGVDWERKGADIAIETIQLLNENAIDARLYLAGIEHNKIPTKYRGLEYVEYIGFLNKNNQDNYYKYIELLKLCHCLLLPTHAECSAIVFNEAAAFGLPSFTYDTGGLSNYVIDGVSGYRLDIQSTAKDFARIIKNAIQNDEFTKLHYGALAIYNKKNNWRTWSRNFSSLVNKLSDS